jgi:DNA-directed RNA polymerase subunit RPC12/RpoP
MKTQNSAMTAYRCDICRRPVDHEIDDRAHRGWQPLVVCERCVREAPALVNPGRIAA